MSSSSQSVGLFASVDASKAGKLWDRALPSETGFNEDGARGGRPDRILGSGTLRGSREEAARSRACNLARKAAFAAHGSRGAVGWAQGATPVIVDGGCCFSSPGFQIASIASSLGPSPAPGDRPSTS